MIGISFIIAGLIHTFKMDYISFYRGVILTLIGVAIESKEYSSQLAFIISILMFVSLILLLVIDGKSKKW